MTNEEIEYYNDEILKRLSFFLNDYSDHISSKMVNSIIKETNVSKEEAYRLLLCETLGIEVNKNKEVYNSYFVPMVKMLEQDKYISNPYYKNIKLDNIKYKNYSFKKDYYKPYQSFVYNDMIKCSDRKLIPQIGFFDSKYEYISILEDKREWMMITPNEINTMEKPINESFGRVVTYGLGLGYFAYMVSLKQDVSEITIVESNKDIIDLFNKYILPQFENKNKIKIINEDAFEFAKRKEVNYDYVFVDIWHDPSDGITKYMLFKLLEKKGVKYNYWIEDTIKCYL